MNLCPKLYMIETVCSQLKVYCYSHWAAVLHILVVELFQFWNNQMVYCFMTKSNVNEIFYIIACPKLMHLPVLWAPTIAMCFFLLFKCIHLSLYCGGSATGKHALKRYANVLSLRNLTKYCSIICFVNTCLSEHLSYWTPVLAKTCLSERLS